MIPFYIVATACVSVFFSIWSHPDGKQWAREQGHMLLSEAGRVRLSIETRTGYRLLLPPALLPPPLETTTFDPGPFPLSREVHVIQRLLESPRAELEAILIPSTATVGLAIVVVGAIVVANVWLWGRLRKVRSHVSLCISELRIVLICAMDETRSSSSVSSRITVSNRSFRLSS